MIKKLLFFTLFFYFLALLENSFLVHFEILDKAPSFILISIIILNIFESAESNYGLFAAIIGGFFLDIFSVKFFGFYILISFLISIFIKFIIKGYIRPIAKLNLIKR